jgi:hypothetical protein
MIHSKLLYFSSFCLSVQLFLLSLEQSQERDTANLHNLESNTGDITDSVSRSTKASYQHFIVLIHKVQATISGDESSDLLGVLDELHSHALSNGRVGLFGLNTDLLEDNTLSHTSTSEGVGLSGGDGVSLVPFLLSPSLGSSVHSELSSSLNTRGFSLSHVELEAKTCVLKPTHKAKPERKKKIK